MQFNLQDFFIHLAYPVGAKDLAGLNEGEWQLLGNGEVPNKPLAKLHAIARIFEKEDPDVALLNEVGGEASLRFFASVFLADKWVPHFVAGNSNRGIESAYLLKASLPVRAELLTHRGHPVKFEYLHEKDPEGGRVAKEIAGMLGVPAAEARKLSRDVPELRLFRSGEATPFLAFLLAHLKSGFDPDGLDPSGIMRRAGEAVALREIHAEVSAALGPSVPIVIAGDMNCIAARIDTFDAMKWVYDAAGYEDALEIAGVVAHERITHVTYYRNIGRAHQIDYIFVPPALQAKVDKAATYVHRFKYEEDGAEIPFPGSNWERRELPSDHYPVVCTLDL